MGVTIHPVPALADNYAYLVVDDATRAAAAVDPSEAAPVESAARALGVTLRAIWNTHHHVDHVGGNQALLAAHPGLEVLGSRHDLDLGRIPGQTRGLADGERFAFAGADVEVLHLPAHTLGHVNYRLGDDVFTGDTLFGGGCGRLFEGTPAQMHAALSRLRALPAHTRLWCGHEYTAANLRFCRTIEPGNVALAARQSSLPARTVPLTVAGERATSSFLRWDAPEVQAFAGTTDPVAAFAAVRRAKDGWRA